MESSNAFTAPPNTPEREWASRYASESSSAQAEESGRSPNKAAVQRFTLPFPTASNSATQSFTILLAEDNPADARLVREALEEHEVGGELVVVSDGESAINYIESIGELCPHLAIIDLNLPKRSGKEVLAAIRSNSGCAAIPVVVLSSSDNAQDRADASHLGATLYIRKPSRLDDFLSLGSIFKSMASSGS